MNASGPQLSLGGTSSAAWREEAMTRAAELEGLLDWIEHASPIGTNATKFRTGIADQIDRVRRTAAHRDLPPRRLFGRRWWWRFKRSFGGASLERALGSLDAAEADLLRLAPDDYVCSLMPSMLAHVNRFLPKDDPRRLRVVSLATKAEQEPLSIAERGAVVAAYHAANSQRRRELLRLRTFRNVLVVATVILLGVAIGLGMLGWARPTLLPVCFVPTGEVVCPTHERLLPTPKASTTSSGAAQSNPASASVAATVNLDQQLSKTVSPWDVAVVEIIGLVAAAVASAFSLRGVRGTSTPYSLPVALAGLKLATGALTAFLGLMLMRGNFVPGLSALDNSAQILSWAIVFGYSQQLFTRFVDRQAQNVLQGVGGHGAGGDRPLATASA
ncbi:MAG: hypothetical protein ACXVRK_05105 [Gaiellaceae bacterium]